MDIHHYFERVEFEGSQALANHHYLKIKYIFLEHALNLYYVLYLAHHFLDRLLVCKNVFLHILCI